MNILQYVLYGLISGLSELLPVSSQAHQALMLHLFGADARMPLLDLLVHSSILFALLTGCRATISRIRREKIHLSHSRRGKRAISESAYELRLIRSATVPMLIVFLIYVFTRRMESNLTAVALMFLINGIILIIPEYTRQANKNASYMSSLDSIVIGILGGLSALPGISRIGAISSYALIRGADRQRVVNWAYLLSIPVLILLCLIDFILIFSTGIGGINFVAIIGYILSAGFAYLGAYLSISFVRFLTARTGYSGFAYYCWGAAMFSLILFLIV